MLLLALPHAISYPSFCSAVNKDETYKTCQSISSRGIKSYKTKILNTTARFEKQKKQNPLIVAARNNSLINPNIHPYQYDSVA
jgi:hypothetical protein